MDIKIDPSQRIRSRKISWALIAALVFIAALVINSSSIALTTPMSKKPGKTETITGKVSEVNMETQAIVVIAKNAGMTIETTSVKFKGYQTMRDIKAGDKVVVTYEMKEGKAYAKSITKLKSVMKTGSSGFFSFRRT